MKLTPANCIYIKTLAARFLPKVNNEVTKSPEVKEGLARLQLLVMVMWRWVMVMWRWVMVMWRWVMVM